MRPVRSVSFDLILVAGAGAVVIDEGQWQDLTNLRLLVLPRKYCNSVVSASQRAQI